MKFQNAAFAACALAMWLAEATEVGAVTQVFNPAALNGPVVVEDFEDDVFVPGVAFSASSGVVRGDSSSYSGGVTTSGIWGLSTNNFPDPITMNFNFPLPARSVGMFFGNDDTCCSAGFTAFLDVFATSGLIDTIGVQANMNDWVDQFLGFNSTVPVTSVKLRYGTGADVGLFHYIDDFQFSLVPEPGAMSLAVVCAAAVAIRRRRG